MFNLISNSLRKRAKVMLILLPILLVSDQLWAKSSKLLILGDSLSAGYGLTQAQSWVSLLQDAWQKSDISVVNAAISGETTDGALARLPRLLAKDHNVVLLPFFLADIALNSDLMQADGIHPNAKAQPIIAESMAQTLKPLVAP